MQKPQTSKVAANSLDLAKFATGVEPIRQAVDMVARGTDCRRPTLKALRHLPDSSLASGGLILPASKIPESGILSDNRIP
jgi:hypothetical protein